MHKHVEFFNKIKFGKFVRLVDFIKKKILGSLFLKYTAPLKMIVSWSKDVGRFR